MGVSFRGGLFGFMARLGRPPVADSDADLLGRFVRSADEAAFTGLVRRHGPMVLAVCRRRLGCDADAEDAFQAVFLALAKSAGTIGRGESLPGWLYRVAYLISLKAAGRRARQPVAALPAAEVPMPDPPLPPCERDDLKAVLDAELAGLPDRFRAVVVLCLIEGRTNAEAAAVLGVPVGTVDSRLNTARTRLRARLTRRGIAVGVGVTLEQLLGGPLRASEGPAFQELVSNTVRAVLAEAAGAGAGAVSPAVADLAHGVATMTTNLRLLAALALTLGLFGGVGAGIYFATAADDPAKAVAAAQDAKPAKPAEKPAVPPSPAVPEAAPVADADKPAAAGALLKPFGAELPADGVPVESILERIERDAELIVRVDVAAFRRVGVFAENGDGTLTAEALLRAVYETKAILPRRVSRLAIRDVLGDALAQVPTNPPCTYQLRGSQLVIVPAYVPPTRPGVDPLDPDDFAETALDPRLVHEQIYGGVVSVAAERKPLAEILADLRKQTGANIVLDPRCEGQDKKAALTVNLTDSRLYDALRVIADMAELKMVYAGNIYYVTTPANAKTFQPARPAPQPFAFPGLGGLSGGPVVPPKQ
jgi:RNA polymerase sigma factor (sigma-70 family)